MAQMTGHAKKHLKIQEEPHTHTPIKTLKTLSAESSRINLVSHHLLNQRGAAAAKVPR